LTTADDFFDHNGGFVPSDLPNNIQEHAARRK
jgi:hypothetical protein